MTTTDHCHQTFTYKDTQLHLTIIHWNRSLLLYITDSAHSANLSGLVLANAGGITTLFPGTDSSLSDSIAALLTARFKVPVLVGCTISNEALQKHRDLVPFIHVSAREAIAKTLATDQ